MRGFFVRFLAITLLLSTFQVTAFAEEGKVQLAKESSSAILMERDTGTILFEKNSDEQLPPASMTKIMTMLLIMEALDQGKITLDEKVRTSERAASMGGSQIFLEVGEEMTLEEMLKGIAIASGNDASVAMAEHLAGSEENFITMMNDKAKSLGLSNTNFMNSNGLPAENHYTTAYDLAVISKELLKYEDILAYTSLYEDYLREGTDKKFWLVNTNKLVKFYPGVDGLKTGFTREAMYCLTVTAKKNDMRVIAVVMGAKTPKERNRQITEMLDYAFSQYSTHNLYDRGHIITTSKVSKGQKPMVEVVTSESVSVLTKKGENIDNVEEVVTINEDLKAPIKKGEQIGTLRLEKEGTVLVEVPLVANEEIGVASWWQIFKRTTAKFSGRS
ncbi:D-alanyl-D-alanine carboxypeptidase family protein [Anaerobacillus isosaccharinicus]|uniref:serine-type D-Ala-D-Ala carboxypeptidase n=1 Tax=Anaerobacillus isosaccharinicus TaxID=1532552 RepID=A0A1S2M4D8_9BACI|nr:D-alanyl-D-alanine carboxypeptidase family protein [Anaerobacillus isosaccharinicus]MBA5585741.1 D-alanyl-D-alanine carboxypeptidase [Anaerobacillus isosaccharinicus]QOY35956.1 D-alanyl-D-alanine carboxypeptidase [Anaerobacillus isosaccharinicus]